MAHPFRFGVLVETMISPSAWAQTARQVEATGFSTLLIRDHFLPDFEGNTYAPIAALTSAALATTRLRVGTLVLDNDFRHPVVMAKEFATLDIMSSGRVEVGLGAGWMQAEYEQMGIPFDPPNVRVSRLEEAIKLYKGFFSGQRFSLQGEYFSVKNLQPFPAAKQQPHPPLLIGAGKKRMCHIAGREADIVGLMTVNTTGGTVYADPHELLAATVEQKLAWVRQGAGHRFGNLEFNMVVTLHLSANRIETAREMIEKNHWKDITPEDVLTMPARLIGTVDEIIAQLRQHRTQFGISYYVVSDKQMSEFAPIVARLVEE